MVPDLRRVFWAVSYKDLEGLLNGVGGCGTGEPPPSMRRATIKTWVVEGSGTVRAIP